MIFHFNSYFHTNNIHQRLYDELNKLVSSRLFRGFKGRLRALREARKASLVQCHTLARDGFMGLFFKWFFGIPFIANIKMTDFNYHWKKWYLRGYLKQVMKYADALIAPSPFYLSKIPEKFRSKSKVIPHFIEDDWLVDSKPKTYTADSVLKLIYVGKLYKVEPNIFKKVMEGLNQPYSLTICTLDEDGEKFEQFKAMSNCEVVSCSRERVKQYLKEAHLHLFLSPEETFGMAALESLACATPVILQKNQGVYDYLSNDLKALSADVHNPEEVLGAIQYGIAHYSRLSEQSIALAKVFTKQQVLDAYKEVYQKVGCNLNSPI